MNEADEMSGRSDDRQFLEVPFLPVEMVLSIPSVSTAALPR